MFTALTVTDLPGARKLKRCFDAVMSLQDPRLKRGELLRFAMQPAPRPIVVPNGRVVKIADKVMGRGGALLEVYEHHLATNADWRELKVKQRAYWTKKRPDLFPTDSSYDQMR